jgi:hypothetical protein
MENKDKLYFIRNVYTGLYYTPDGGKGGWTPSKLVAMVYFEAGAKAAIAEAAEQFGISKGEMILEALN